MAVSGTYDLTQVRVVWCHMHISAYAERGLGFEMTYVFGMHLVSVKTILDASD